MALWLLCSTWACIVPQSVCLYLVRSSCSAEEEVVGNSLYVPLLDYSCCHLVRLLVRISQHLVLLVTRQMCQQHDVVPCSARAG